MSERKKKRQDAHEDIAPKDVREQDAPADVDESALEDDVLKKELEEARAKVGEYLDAARRIQAEFDNYRKRNAQLRAESMDDGAREAVMPLLGVYDNLIRAVQAADEAGDTSPISEGVRMCAKTYMEALEKVGVSEIPAEGAVFDPNMHNAVLTVPPDDEAQEGMVAEVLQKGYTMRDKILRVAMVKVYHA